MRDGIMYWGGPDSTVWNFFIWLRARDRPSVVRGYLEMKGGLSLIGISMKTLLASVHAQTAQRGLPLLAYSAVIKASIPNDHRSQTIQGVQMGLLEML